MDDEENKTGLQSKSSRTEHLKPWQFKPGQSGNPSGKKEGTVSLKTYAKNMLQEMNEEQRQEFLKGIDKKTIWEMAEDKPGQGVQVSGELTSKVISVDE